MGLGGSIPLPISFSEIEAYCSLRGITGAGERDRLLRFLHVLDQEWMRLHAEQAEKESGQGSLTPPPPSHSPPRDGRRGKSTRAPIS